MAEAAGAMSTLNDLVLAVLAGGGGDLSDVRFNVALSEAAVAEAAMAEAAVVEAAVAEAAIE